MGTIRNEMTIVHYWKKDEVEKLREDAIKVLAKLLGEMQEMKNILKI